MRRAPRRTSISGTGKDASNGGCVQTWIDLLQGPGGAATGSLTKLRGACGIRRETDGQDRHPLPVEPLLPAQLKTPIAAPVRLWRNLPSASLFLTASNKCTSPKQIGVPNLLRTISPFASDLLLRFASPWLAALTGEIAGQGAFS